MIIIISAVVTRKRRAQAGVLSDPRRFNVAITRAKVSLHGILRDRKQHEGPDSSRWKSICA